MTEQLTDDDLMMEFYGWHRNPELCSRCQPAHPCPSALAIAELLRLRSRLELNKR